MTEVIDNWKFNSQPANSQNGLCSLEIFKYGSARFLIHKGDLLSFDNELRYCSLVEKITSANDLAKIFVNPNEILSYDNKPYIYNSIVVIGSKLAINGQNHLVCESSKADELALLNEKHKVIPIPAIKLPCTTEGFYKHLVNNGVFPQNSSLRLRFE